MLVVIVVVAVVAVDVVVMVVVVVTVVVVVVCVLSGLAFTFTTPPFPEKNQEQILFVYLGFPTGLPNGIYAYQKIPTLDSYFERSCKGKFWYIL
jgi:hypothetical protein